MLHGGTVMETYYIYIAIFEKIASHFLSIWCIAIVSMMSNMNRKGMMPAYTRRDKLLFFMAFYLEYACVKI